MATLVIPHDVLVSIAIVPGLFERCSERVQELFYAREVVGQRGPAIATQLHVICHRRVARVAWMR